MSVNAAPKNFIRFVICLLIYPNIVTYSADGFTYTLGIFIVEFMAYFNEGAEATSWIASIMVGVTLGSGMHNFAPPW